jgi:hypothetical protein
MNNFEKLKTDLINAIFKSYDSVGIVYDTHGYDFSSVFRTYYSFLGRLIDPKPRKVHISREIQKKINGRDAESKRLKKLFFHMRDKFKEGEDLNGFLSKTIFNKIEDDDMLLDDWHIKHLHMDLKDLDFFDVNRKMSGDLLFAVVLIDDVYFLQITNHGKDDFVDTSYLSIIKNNWESKLLIEHKEIQALSYSADQPEEIKKYRKSGVNYFIHEIDGRFYSVRYSSGYTIAKTDINATFSVSNFIKTFSSIEFEYDRLEFKPFVIGDFGKIIDKSGNFQEMYYKVI